MRMTRILLRTEKSLRHAAAFTVLIAGLCVFPGASLSAKSKAKPSKSEGVSSSSASADAMMNSVYGRAHGARANVAEDSDPSKVIGVVIVSRHGNRPPLKDNATLDRETSNTWPKWDVPPGYLTSRGRKLVVEMGDYYRQRFTKEGVLTGKDLEDVKHAYFHTNTIQRTVQTGCALAEGLFPSTTTTVHYLVKKTDLLYTGAPLNHKMSDAAMNGRIGNNAEALAKSMNPQFDLIEKALGQPGMYQRSLSSIGLAAGMADNFMCEYCEGRPMDEVAFGRATPAELEEMLKILALDFDIRARTTYLSRTRMSNLVSHVSATLQKLASGKPVDGAFGDSDDKLFVIVGHDTTISSIGGLLHLDWVLPDTGRNLCPAGGALVFELRKHESRKPGSTGEYYVRVYYAAETLAQMHEDAKLSLDNPPSIAPIFVPGSSKAGQWYDSPLSDFVKVVNSAIDPSLVYPVDDGKKQ
jgi:4-phytase/acid phosphatase